MKKQLLVGLVSVVIIAMLQMGEFSGVVRAAPENPNAPVDLFDVETNYQGVYGAPGEPGANLKAWVEVKATQPGSGQHTILVGIFDHQEFQWVLTQVFTFQDRIIWAPEWQFKNVPDSYEVYLYYEDGGSWVFADKAIGWIQADKDVQCDPEHCPFSPNEYTYPFISSEGGDFKWVKQYFWYFDNDEYGDMVGTDRLNRLREFTNNPLNLGKLQIEYRRVDVNGNNAEGWDAGFEEWFGDVCTFVVYGTDTNLPEPGIAHEELTGACSVTRDEEAEVWTRETEDLQVYVGHDPTGVYNSGDPRVYYVGIKFFRRPEQRGQNFNLHTEFEMLDGVLIDTLLVSSQ